MKRKAGLLCCLVFTFLLVTASPLAAGEITYKGDPITLRYSNYIPESAPAIQLGTIPWLNLIEERSQGKIKTKRYFGGVLHGARDGFKATVSDITDLTQGFPLYSRGSFDLLHVLDLPFAFPNACVGTKVAEELAAKYFKEEYEKMGVYMALNLVITPFNLLTKKPVRTLEDLKGLKVRCGGGTSNLIWKALGASPVSIPSPEAYSSFQRGIVDAIAWGDSAFHTYELYEIGKYRTVLNISTAGCAMCLNRNFFDTLPPDLKQNLYESCRIGAQMMAAAYDENSVDGENVMNAAGVKTIVLSPEEQARWNARLEPLWDDFITQNEAKGLPARALVKDLRSLVEKYKGWSQEDLLRDAMQHPIQGIIDFK